MAKSEYFYSRFDEKWKVMGKHDKTKVNEQRVVSWRDFIKACLLRLLSTPPSLRIRMVLSSDYREGISREGTMTCFRGEGTVQRALPNVFQIPSMFSMPKHHIL